MTHQIKLFTIFSVSFIFDTDDIRMINVGVDIYLNDDMS